MAGTNNAINNTAYSLTATTGGVTATAGGLTATAGGLTVTAGDTTLTPLAAATAGLLTKTTTGVVGAIENTANDGYVLISKADASNPVWAGLTAGANITITPGANSISIAASGGSGMSWAAETGATKTIVVGEGYIANRAGGVAFALPATSSVGDLFEIAGMDGLWSITQAANQYIFLGSVETTVGAGGSITATDAKDCVSAVCIEADKGWVIKSSVGNLTLA
jgi:hypothetical protein